ncbi:heme-binding protein (plasmid) [Gemmatirosa kalamazoonensis]|uniref:Heme-binding protein n=1 Tax=Gemmatirosa kalamazoonensis TaxID=861299 RepID=W0RQ91_9BACT|nr:PQQ-dependent sugar dehydrogenase [Gemmatirosa kalamazoonensis]AHG93164.1 heme-binding protein [Gemmatirosa kalamazoonensis]
MRLARYPLLLALLATPALAQPRGNPTARPATIPASGAVPREPAVEQKLRDEVKAPDGFTLTLFAGPPVAMYPTCVAESPDGALFVGVDPNLSLSQLKGVGRVMRLVDDDHDGRADRYTTFAEMDSPRGVAFDGRTLYVMHPPNLTAYRDTDGDGVADWQQNIVEGLGFDLDFRGADHTTNQIALGIDGWIYVAVGDYGYRKAVGTDGTQISHRGGSVVRVRPDGTHLEIYATGTRNIYDVAIDPLLHVYARDNTNDGDGWDTRLHYLAPGANMGYPTLYQNFKTEHFPSLYDYGAGAGVGSVFVQDPSLPPEYGNTLYTGDWTKNRIYRHPLSPKGASFDARQEEFLTVVRPSDIVADAQGSLFVASLSGGQFTYNADTVGYVFRVRRSDVAPAALLPIDKAPDAQLRTMLASGNALVRLHAQQEILRRPASDATVRALQSAVADAKASAEARAAAMFTLKQLVGARANAALEQAAADASAPVRETAVRALADRPDQAEGVHTALLVKALGDADAHVRVQALNALVRLGATDAADAIAPLVGSDDQALQHLAVHALVALGARDAALKVVDGGTPAARDGALRALAMMYDQPTVTALLARLDRADAASREPLLHTLARLYDREGFWAGDWWTTKPAHLGPYFDPTPWEGSARIRPALARALTAARGDALDRIAKDFAANQVLPRGAPAFLAAVPANEPLRAQAIDALVGRAQLDAESVTLAQQLDARGPALRAAVAQLLSGESALGAGTLPLLRTVVLDAKLDAAVRGQLLTALSQVPGPSARDAAAEVFGRLMPVPGLPAAATPAAAASAAPTPPAGSAGAGDPVESAWRRYVGDRRRLADLDWFIAQARSGTPAQRTLAYAVLVQSVRTPRTPAPVREKVAPVLEAAWRDPASTPSLVQAITLMHVESQYADRLQAVGQQQKKP